MSLMAHYQFLDICGLINTNFKNYYRFLSSIEIINL